MKINIEKILTNICVNIECETLFINKNFLTQKIFDYEKFLRRIKEFFKIKKIDDIFVKTKKYIFFKF